MTTPMYSSGISTVSISTGSMSLPSTVRVTISGLPTASSNPSRRIISMRMASCNSPRPMTVKVSGAFCSTRMETLVSSSLSRRSARLREVTYWPSRPQNGEVLTDELHGDGGLVDEDVGQRIGSLVAGDGLADGDAGDAGYGDDIAQFGFRDVGALQAAEAEELGDLDLFDLTAQLGDADFFAGAQGAVENARNGQAAEVVAVVEIGDQDLQRRGGISGGRRNGLDDGFKQRLKIDRPGTSRSVVAVPSLALV